MNNFPGNYTPLVHTVYRITERFSTFVECWIEPSLKQSKYWPKNTNQIHFQELGLFTIIGGRGENEKLNINWQISKLFWSLLSVILSDPPNKDGNAWFTAEPLKPLSDQYLLPMPHIWFPVVEMRKSLLYILWCACLSNVKTAEPIRPKFCVGPHMTPGKVCGT